MATYPELYLHIAGKRIERGARRGFAVLHPVPGEPLGELPLADAADLDRALDTAARGSASGVIRRRSSAPPF